eukprot:1158566-Pelagomonas_calceolata.AAC.10
MPVPRPVPPEKTDRIGVLEKDNFIAVVVVVVMSALLLLAAVLLFGMFRRMRRQHANRVKSLLVIPPEHLQIINLPVVRGLGGSGCSWHSSKFTYSN